MTTWCQCNETDDAKLIETVREYGAITTKKQLLDAGLYKKCRSGCKRPCVPNVLAQARKYSQAHQAAAEKEPTHV